MSWLVPRNELTIGQSRAVESSPEQHRLVLGSPGSGKTIVLVHRAQHLIEQYNIPPERCRLFVFTNALKAYIRAGLRDLDLPDDRVMTFDAWCSEYHEDRISERLPWRGRGPDWEGIRKAVWAKTRELKASDRYRPSGSWSRLFTAWRKTRGLKASERPLEFVMVDEGQDLDRRDFETLTAVAQHVTVFMDPKQKLYERDADELGVARALGLRKRNLVLLDAYRCSPYIVRVGASFIRDDVERQQFIEQNPPVEKDERLLPLLYLARGADDERANLVDVVRTRIARNERVAILLPTKRHMFSYARALREAGLEVEVNQPAWKKKAEDALPDIDFATTLPKLMAFPSSKGLTFDTVLMPRLNRKFLGKKNPDLLERWLFVGITRATRWIYISSTDGEDTLFLDRFRALEQRQQMTIQRGTDDPGASASAGTEPEDTDKAEEDDLTDLF